MGRDKARIPHPRTGLELAERTASILAACVPMAIEVGPGYTSLPSVLEVPRGGGPLAAIAAGAEALSQRGWRGPAVVVATDLPRLSIEVVRWLANQPEGPSVVPMSDGRPQPLCALYQRGALESARRLIGSGRSSIGSLLDDIHLRLVEPNEWARAAGDPRCLDDVDTPEDLQALIRTARGRHRPSGS